MSHSVRPYRRQPTRLPHPCDSLGKNTGVGCHFLLQCMNVKSKSEVAQLCLTLGNPMDCSPPDSSVHGIFQARVLEWVPLPPPIDCYQWPVRNPAARQEVSRGQGSQAPSAFITPLHCPQRGPSSLKKMTSGLPLSLTPVRDPESRNPLGPRPDS